jgi:hypothetical protein
MTEGQKKKPGVAFWATVVVVLVLVVYPLSCGPANWVVVQRWCPARLIDLYSWIYAPIWWLENYGPQQIRDGIERYCTFWAGT